MKIKKPTKDWQLAGLYFSLHTAIVILIGAIYSLLVVYIFSRISFNDFVSQIISFIILLFMIWLPIRLASLIMIKYFSIKNAEKIAKIATVFPLVLALIFLARDLLITNIDGIPIVRNYPLSIAEDIIRLAVFYLLTRYYLSKKDNAHSVK